MVDVLFITPNLSSSVKHEINGTMILGTLLLQDGFDVQVLRYSEIEGYQENYKLFIDDFVEKILERQPKCVSFYTVWTCYHIVQRLCRELKRRDSDIALVLGGPHSSLLARETMECESAVDFICAGEGETTIVPFMRRLLRGEGPSFDQIPGLNYREDGQLRCNTQPPLLSDLDHEPYWDDRLLLSKYTGRSEQLDPAAYYTPVEVGRGCPYNCTFCSTSTYWRRTYRLKSPKRIVEEIKYFRDRFGYTSFLLSHDALTANKKMMMELCNEIIGQKLDINWECSGRVDCLDEELLAKMKEAGLKFLHMGIETGSERMQKLVNKNLDLSKAKQTIQMMLDMGVYMAVFFIYGFPEETEADLNDTLKMIFDLCDMGVRDVQAISCMFSPATKITRDYYDQLVLDHDYQVVAMSRFGCTEEYEMIEKNKPLYTSLYHLHTPLRDSYPYVKFLSLLYQKFPKYARYIRPYYNGDYLKLYRDMVKNNPEWLGPDVASLEEQLHSDPLKIMLNTLRDIDGPGIEKVRDLLRFENDLKRFKRGQDGDVQIKQYAFDYQDVVKQLPVEQFSDGVSRMIFRKDKGKVSVVRIAVS